MSDALNVVPSANQVETGVRNTETVSEALGDILADTYHLTFKTHAYHWNVEGPLFYSIHNLTEEHYENMFAAADDLAERIRALGHLAPASMKDIVARSRVDDSSAKTSAVEMVTDLAGDHERLAHRLHALIEIAAEAKDPVTEDLSTERSAFHEQAAWMLRAIAKS
ncbi:MAG: DNA starvation/stationary phase protection protein [Pseudomonadota bacterium]